MSRPGVFAAGAGAGALLAKLAAGYFSAIQMPGPAIWLASAALLLSAAVAAAVLPALRAARVDVIQALRQVV